MILHVNSSSIVWKNGILGLYKQKQSFEMVKAVHIKIGSEERQKGAEKMWQIVAKNCKNYKK